MSRAASGDESHLLCVRCGYDLRGSAPEQRCPECSTPVGASTKRRNLQHADPHWLRMVQVGLTLLFACLSTLCGVGLLSIPALAVAASLHAMEAIGAALLYVDLVLTVLSLPGAFIGALLVLRRNPATPPDSRGPTARRAALVFLWMAAFAGVLISPAVRVGMFAGPFLLIILALGLSGFALCMIGVLSDLIRRAPLRSRANASALAVLVGGTIVLLIANAVVQSASPRALSAGDSLRLALVMLTMIAVPTSAYFYLQFLWLARQSVRAAFVARLRDPDN